MTKNWTKYLLLFLTLLISTIRAQYISVNTSDTKEQLVQKLIGTNNTCISVSNVTISGYNSSGVFSYGYINSNGSNFEINEGILLTSGNADNSPGSFSGIQSFGNNSGWDGDQDLENAAGISNTTNATILEFDFIPNTNKISFDYIFLSEQYLRQGDPGTCGYTDAFAFLIKKIGDPNYKNLALIPNTNTPITSETVRGPGGRCPENNAQYFGHYNSNGSPTSFNGQTAILTAQSDVIPGNTYHIKLVIADQGNGLYDSGVILKSGSFVGSKDLGPDRLISKNNALCQGESLTLDATTSGATHQWYKDGIAISGATGATYTVSTAGKYEVMINSAACSLKGSITIEYIDKADVSTKTFTNCDSDFDGRISVKLQDLNPLIINNYKQDFVVKYYQNQADAIAGNANTLPNDWAYNGDTTIYIRVENGTCQPEIKSIIFKFGDKVNLLADVISQDICNDNLDGTKAINLKDFDTFFTTDSSVDIKYFNSEVDAKNNINPINNLLNITNSGTYFLRFEKLGSCANWGKLTVSIRVPKSSSTLKDVQICKNATTILNAGTDFDHYSWYNENNPSVAIAQGDALMASIINAPIGKYYVDLTFNNCTYRQYVNVTAADTPKFENIEITGSTVTITVSGGSLPYQYSLDGVNFQNSNVFNNVSRGSHVVYVKDKNDCEVIQSKFLIVNLINAITPNGDGINDTLDYSDLNIKENVSIKIFDRYGSLVYQSEGQNYIWDGKSSGRNVNSGTYWYLINWIEPLTKFQTYFSGWILVKNRD